MSNDLMNLVETGTLADDEVLRKTRNIYENLLRTSPYVTTGNFTSIHPDDLNLLFAQYDQLFFGGRCREGLGGCSLRFRISRRMTAAGGKTTRYTPKRGQSLPYYEISVSSTLLFQTFAGDGHRPILVSGVECRDRLEALQRVFEHELVHLLEILLWNTSRCTAPWFQSVAYRFFGHTAHTHQLVTPREQAFVKFRIHPGSRVRFRLDGQVHTGVVNRITKRATVLAPDARGERYSDGKRYSKFYVPLLMLEAIDDVEPPGAN